MATKYGFWICLLAVLLSNFQCSFGEENNQLKNESSVENNEKNGAESSINENNLVPDANIFDGNDDDGYKLFERRSAPYGPIYQPNVYPNRTYNKIKYSPYQTLPGTYSKNVYQSSRYMPYGKYSAKSIYSNYLATGAYQYHSQKCSNHYGQTPQISHQDLSSAFSYAQNQVRSYEQRYGNFSYMEPPLVLKEKEALLVEYTSEYFAKYKCLSKYQASTYLPTIKLGSHYANENKYGDTSCYSSYSRAGKPGWKLQCPNYNSKYRTFDGSCNNLRHPYWGKSFVCHIRLLPPDYSDGLHAPRLSYSGYNLPNPRLLSNLVHKDLPLDAYYTHFKMAWGQFLNHDITHTPVHSSYLNNVKKYGDLDCCRQRYHKQCLPIDVVPAPYDYMYNKYNNTCINFVRSAPCPLCDLGPRQQINVVTSFIDGSTIYGSSLNDSVSLRSYRDGLLATTSDKYGYPILIQTANPYRNECSPKYPGTKCFSSGDLRVNQHPVLMTLHVVFVRRHNQHALALKKVNPSWNDEKLFQEARRILIAEFQLITYKEYLPIVFGPTLMDYFNLNIRYSGHTVYEPYTDPTSWNDYATAACRFGHSQIQGWFGIYGKMPNQYHGRGYWLRDKFFDPSDIYEGWTDGLIQGLLVEHSKSVDPHVAEDVKNYLYRKKGERFGGDLVARNIQRGRDHGIPGYANYLRFCFGYEVKSWDDLTRFIPKEVVQLLKQIYASPLDIDFFTGGISEKHFPDGDVGPTFACVLGIQYYHLKFGDRYYFEHGGQSGSFTPAQLDSIRATTSLAKFLCRATYLGAIQKMAFFPESKYNYKIPCNNFPEINYNLWKGY